MSLSSARPHDWLLPAALSLQHFPGVSACLLRGYESPIPSSHGCLTPAVVVASATQGGAKDVAASVDSLLQLAAVYEAVTGDRASAVGAAAAVVAALVEQEGVVDRLMPSTVTADGVFRALPVTWGIDRSVVPACVAVCPMLMAPPHE